MPEPEGAAFLDLIDEDDAAALRGAGARRTFRRGTTLFHEGDISSRVLVLLEGRVKISHYTDDGREIILAVRGPGELLGELSAIDDEPLSAAVTAIDDVTATVLTSETFREFLKTRPGVSFLLLQLVTRKLRDADRKRIEFAAYDTIGRVARRLVELGDRFGEAGASGTRIALPLSQEELAGWIGASREAVSKALQSLKSRGLIEVQRREITILDSDGLRRRAT